MTDEKLKQLQDMRWNIEELQIMIDSIRSSNKCDVKFGSSKNKKPCDKCSVCVSDSLREVEVEVTAAAQALMRAALSDILQKCLDTLKEEFDNA